MDSAVLLLPDARDNGGLFIPAAPELLACGQQLQLRVVQADHGELPGWTDLTGIDGEGFVEVPVQGNDGRYLFAEPGPDLHALLAAVSQPLTLLIRLSGEQVLSWPMLVDDRQSGTAPEEAAAEDLPQAADADRLPETADAPAPQAETGTAPEEAAAEDLPQAADADRLPETDDAPAAEMSQVSAGRRRAGSGPLRRRVLTAAAAAAALAGIGVIWLSLLQDPQEASGSDAPGGACALSSMSDASILQTCADAGADDRVLMDLAYEALHAGRCDLGLRILFSRGRAGLGEASYYLAKAYDEHSGDAVSCVTKDRDTAIYWYEKARLTRDRGAEAAAALEVLTTR